MDVQLGLTPVKIADRPVVVTTKYNVTLLYLGPVIDGSTITLGSEYIHASNEELWARSLVAPSSAITVIDYNAGNQLVETITIPGSSPRDMEATDNTKTLYFQGTNTYTVQKNVDVPLSIGSRIRFRVDNLIALTITKEIGVVFKGRHDDVPIKLEAGEGYFVEIEKVDTDTWLYSGTLVIA